MAPPAPGIVPALRDAPLRDRDGLLLGRVGDVLYDAVSNRPAWVVVLLSDGRATLAPAARARHAVDGLCLPVGADAVRGCPASATDVAAAARHYGMRRFARDGGAAVAARFTCAGPALDGARAA
jgi:hypothetical protein